MSIRLLKPSLTTLALAAGLLAAQSASALTLNTTGLKANATLTFSVPAFGSSTAAGITFAPLGNTVQNPDVIVVDPDGFEDPVPQFVLPVTKADVTVGWDLSIKATSGSSARSALLLKRGARNVVLANFVVDFKGKQIKADYIIAGATTPTASVYSFEEITPQKISFKNLVLNQSVTLGKMILTESAQQTLGDSLALSAPLRATLVTQEWGTIAVLVTSFKRSPAVSDKPFTAADVPAGL